MSSSFQYLSGDPYEQEANVRSLHEKLIHENLHNHEHAQRLAQDLEVVMTDSPPAPAKGSPTGFHSGSRADEALDSESDEDGYSVLTKSEKIFKEGFRKRRASPMQGLREFQAAIKALMEDMYQVRLGRTRNTFKLHHWLSDRSSRALFGLYGPKCDTVVDPSWRLFLEMLFHTDDNLNFAASYPMRAQRAILMAMERLWSSRNVSLEQVLRGVRAALGPEPLSSDLDPILPEFLDADNFGRFLAGLPPREIRRVVSWSQQPIEHLSVPTPTVSSSRKPAPAPRQSTAQAQSPAQSSQPSPKITAAAVAVAVAIATAAPPATQVQIQPLQPTAANMPPIIQPPLPPPPPPPPPQVQPPVAPPQNVVPPNPAAQTGARFSKTPRPPYAQALVPRDFYDPVQYARNPAGWDAAHSVIANASFHGVVGFSNMGTLGPIATKGDLAGDFRACLITKCASGYIRTHHNGSPRFAGPGKDHGPIWNWYIGLIQGPNGAFAEGRFRKYIMAELEAVLPAAVRTTVNTLRQPLALLVAGLNVVMNAIAAPANAATISNSQTLIGAANASTAQVPPMVHQIGPVQGGGPNVVVPTPGPNNPSTSTLRPPHTSGIGSRLRSNKRRLNEMTESDDDVSGVGEPNDDSGSLEETASATRGESERSNWDDDGDDDDEADFSEAEEAELPPSKRRRR